jgi:hypothetical protein
MMKTVFTGKEFHKLLKFFAKCVADGAYDKMHYSRWKVLINQWTHDDAVCSIELNDGGTEFELINQNYDCMYFDTRDSSFGSFLDDMYASGTALELEEIMQGTSSQTYATTNMTETTYTGSPYKTTTNYWDDYTGIGVASTKADVNICSRSLNDLFDDVDELKKAIEEKKGNEDMKGFNFDFGFCTNDNVKMSPYGLAIMNTAGTYVAYDAKSDSVVDVDCFNFNGGKYMFKMPVAIKDIKKGDVVIHNKVPMFVTDVTNGIKVVDIREGEKKEIMPATNMFGFNFVTKVMSVFDGMMNGMNTDNPFGNMLPFFMMDSSKGDNDAMLMFMMMQGQTGSVDMFSNPMMMYFMMKDGKNNDMLPLMMMMNMNKPVEKHECKCGGHCADHDNE